MTVIFYWRFFCYCCTSNHIVLFIVLQLKSYVLPSDEQFAFLYPFFPVNRTFCTHQAYNLCAWLLFELKFSHIIPLVFIFFTWFVCIWTLRVTVTTQTRTKKKVSIIIMRVQPKQSKNVSQQKKTEPHGKQIMRW